MAKCRNLRRKHPEMVDELSTRLHRWFEGVSPK
jgi:hypothetical protein